VIPDSFKHDLLARVDIVAVIDARVPLRKAGANFSACCPFHTEKTPSFVVSPVRQTYHCFGCQAHGNAISFLMEYAGFGYVDAVRELAESVGMAVPDSRGALSGDKRQSGDLYAVLERAAAYYKERLKGTPHAIEYLKRRGLEGRVAARYGIGYAPAGWQNLETVYADYADSALVGAGLVVVNDEGRRYDRFRDRIMFPILDARARVIGFGGRILTSVSGRDEGGPKYLNSPETPVFEKGRELYGLPQAREAIRNLRQVLVVEGYMDVVMLAQHGVGNAVATLGTATTPLHLQKLLRITDEVVFCFDGDAAGRKAAWQALEVSLPLLTDAKTLRFLFLPAEHDPDSFVRAAGREAFEHAARNAEPLSAFFLKELRARHDTGGAEGRAQLAHAAGPLLKRIAAPALQLQLVKLLAELAGLTPGELAKLAEIRSPAAPVAPSRAAQFARPAPAVDQRLPRVLLRCVVASPALARALPAGGVGATGLVGQALQDLREWASSDEERLTAAVLAERFGDAEFAPLLRQLEAELMELEIDEAGAMAEFHGALHKLRVESLKARREELGRKEAEWTDAERGEYRALLLEIHSDPAPLRPASGGPN
jgi:DNA primase